MPQIYNVLFAIFVCLYSVLPSGTSSPSSQPFEAQLSVMIWQTASLLPPQHHNLAVHWSSFVLQLLVPKAKGLFMPLHLPSLRGVGLALHDLQPPHRCGMHLPKTVVMQRGTGDHTKTGGAVIGSPKYIISTCCFSNFSLYWINFSLNLSFSCQPTILYL